MVLNVGLFSWNGQEAQQSMTKILANAMMLFTLVAAMQKPAQAQDFILGDTQSGGGLPPPALVYYPVGSLNNRFFHSRLDDSYDPPFGYGEYAEYGPWAYRRYVVPSCKHTMPAPKRSTFRHRSVLDCY